jgi:citrate lyase beta subunit
MTMDPGVVLEELELAHRAFGASRDPREHARRVLDALPPQVRGEPTRHVARQLIAHIEMAEARLRGREPAA